MSRLDIKTPSRAQTVGEGLYRDMERRIAASPPGLCPVDMSLSFLQLCHAQTCGKCVPCRIGLGQLTLLINQVLDGEATMETIAIIEKTARCIVYSADCAIGRDAARLVVEGREGLAAQSVLLLLGMAAFLFVLLSLLARRFETLRLERWAIFVVFGILMITSLRASFAPRYLLACLMVLGVLGVYAWRGWCGTEKAVRRAGDRGQSGRIWTAVFATA